MKFKNESGLEFTDISSEAWRCYEWESGYEVLIKAPLMLHVSENGGHRVFDASGKSHYVAPGWIHLRWMTKQGRPHFVK